MRGTSHGMQTINAATGRKRWREWTRFGEWKSREFVQVKRARVFRWPLAWVGEWPPVGHTRCDRRVLRLGTPDAIFKRMLGRGAEPGSGLTHEGSPCRTSSRWGKSVTETRNCWGSVGQAPHSLSPSQPPPPTKEKLQAPWEAMEVRGPFSAAGGGGAEARRSGSPAWPRPHPGPHRAPCPGHKPSQPVSVPERGPLALAPPPACRAGAQGQGSSRSSRSPCQGHVLWTECGAGGGRQPSRGHTDFPWPRAERGPLLGRRRGAGQPLPLMSGCEGRGAGAALGRERPGSRRWRRREGCAPPPPHPQRAAWP